MADKNKRPIIVIKKKVAHAGHHGGAWKVAYADFVTAMMALFIVLWLTSSGEKVRKMIAGYFNDPSGKTNEMGTDRYGGGESMAYNRDNIHELKANLEKSIVQRPDLKPLADQIEIAITPEGMRVELVETKDGTFFESGSALLKPAGKELLQILAKELGGVPNRVSMEGYTDAKPYSDNTKYDNWELSTDRANAARRAMQATGLRPGQVSQVRGFADQKLHLPLNPFDPSNRRISVIIHYVDPAPPPTGFPDPNAEKKPGDAPNAKENPNGAAKGSANDGDKATGKRGETTKAADATPAKPAAALPAPVASKQTMMQSVMGAPKAMVGKVTGMFGHKSAPAAAPGSKEVKKP